MLRAPVMVPNHAVHLSIYFKGPQPPTVGAPQKTQSKIKFVNPNTDNYDRNIRHAATLQKERGYRNIQNNELEGRTAIVCGSGNTLTSPEVLEEITRLVKEENALIFACKQAIKILYDRGFKVDYGVSMDPGGHIARPEKIYRAPGTKHIIASSSDPLLFDYLSCGLPFSEWIGTLSEDDKKQVYKETFSEHITTISYGGLVEELHPEILIFHSATGYYKDEEHNEVRLYNELFEDPHCMGGGYNVVNRAASAAMFMGCDPIIFAGTDCGWREGQSFYADGTNNRPGVDMSDDGAVDGKPWWTRPDMLASGVALAKLAKKKPKAIIELENVRRQLENFRKNINNPLTDQVAKALMEEDVRKLTKFTHRQEELIKALPTIRFLGDTMPAGLMHKDDAFLQRCANFHE